ncbi:type VI secretion system baseplate subunit TssF [Pseudomonas sp. NPDC098747]|uniref:type VI secretion system baseplate subunit TssF n=1 Tax=Pseudomonas sp. NPDC098747 TaxID=3364487 RepID=UPI00383BE4B9
MSFNHYYQSELTALRQLGKRFAERNPALAPFLGEGRRDPDVERLLEGFAFLTGRLRQKLDDELPELTHSLMHLLWPNYMRPLPSFSMLQFDPLKQAVHVPRHTSVNSEKIQGIHCRFRTVFDTQVLPLTLDALDYSIKGDGAYLSLRLQMPPGRHLDELQFKSLRLHLAGDRSISQLLYLSLLRHLDGLQMTLLDDTGHPLRDEDGEPLPALALETEQVHPLGFAEDQALIPYPLNTFRGYRYLQEYFAFQEKFLFVDLEGMDRLSRQPVERLKRARGFELRFDIRKVGVQHIRPTLDNVRLYCTPVVNLFRHEATPIRLDGKQEQYRLLPDELDPSHCGVFSVDRVIGWKPDGAGYKEYVPFESFEHDRSFGIADARPHYSVRQQPSMFGSEIETYLSFSQGSLTQGSTVSVELTCTNQDLACQLGVGKICLPAEGTPDFLSFRNISPVTPSYAPPLHQDFLWKLISNMPLNYLSLANVEALKVILETYDLPRYYDRQAASVSRQQLNGLQHIQHVHIDRLHLGLPIRGVRTELTINPEGTLGEGDMFLFASVLNEFFALYASLNSFHELHVKSTQGETYTWTPRMGLQPLM